MISLLMVFAAASAPAQQLPTIRVMALPIDSGAEPFYAQALGFFKEAGINVEIVTTVSNGALVAAAISGGAGDIGQSNIVSILSARDRGLPFVVVAGSKLFIAHLHQNALVVPRDSAIRTARDLAGKTVGIVGLKNIEEIALDTWLDQSGANSAAVKTIELRSTVMASALAEGRVDAALINQPYLDEALSRKTMRVLAYPYEAIGKDFLVGCWFTTSAWAHEHPTLVRAFASAMNKAAAWANQNPAQAAHIYEQAMKVPITVSALPQYSVGLDPKHIQRLIDLSAKYGALRSSFSATDLLASSR